MSKRTGLPDAEVAFLRRAFAWAQTALSKGERPFGAVIVSPDGRIVGEGHACSHETGDISAHAEITAIRQAMRISTRDQLQSCTIYASAEPCAMCAGAIYWSNIRRVVFGLDEERLRALRNVSDRGAALTISCRAVLASGGHPTTVIGPVLQDEAIAPHEAFWQTLERTPRDLLEHRPLER